MILLDGTKISLNIIKELQKKVFELSFKPKLVIFKVGDRADSQSYIKRKVDIGKKIGFEVEIKSFSTEIKRSEIESQIRETNQDNSVHGIIVQLPLPDNLSSSDIIDCISEYKDADGLTKINIYKLINNEKGIIPATSRGILTLLQAYNIDISSKHIVVVGRSLLVGKSIALNLLNNDATVTIAHSKTKNLKQITKSADILIVAIGKPHFINKEYVSEGQVVIDVGISPIDETIKGDVDFENVKDVVGAISPVPRGVGPMTVISLFQNILDGLEFSKRV